jgi:hypothetical protein
MSIEPDMKDVLIAVLDNEWRDIHHSRIQEWSSLGIVAAAHAALSQVPKLVADSTINLRPTTVVLIASALAAAFAIVGALVTCRHRRLMVIKLRRIYDVEDKLGLVAIGVIPDDAQIKDVPEWRGLSLPPLRSTSGLILLFYALFALIDVAIFVSALIPSAAK